jgi:O-antigen/teichoic acid export membrane protein
MTGHQVVLRNIMVSAAVINIVLNLLLAPRFGMAGAAFAVTFCIAYWNIYALVYIHRKFGKSTGYFPSPSWLIGKPGKPSSHE